MAAPEQAKVTIAQHLDGAKLPESIERTPGDSPNSLLSLGARGNRRVVFIGAG